MVALAGGAGWPSPGGMEADITEADVSRTAQFSSGKDPGLAQFSSGKDLGLAQFSLGKDPGLAQFASGKESCRHLGLLVESCPW